MAKSTTPGSPITFIDTSEEVKKTLEGLSKTALRASGKVIRKLIRERIATDHISHTKNFKNHIATWVFISRETGQPQMQVGFYSRARVMKKHKAPSHASPHWIEFGTQPHTIPKQDKYNKNKLPQEKFMAYGNNHYGSKVNHKGQKPTNLLRDTVMNNVAEIRKAQEEYLAKLSKTIEEAKAEIYEGEEEESD